MEEKFSLRDFYTKFKQNKVSLAFQGMISQDLLSLIGLSLRRKPDNEVLAKRLFGMVVELAQNIYHYSAEKSYSEKDKKNVGVGIIAIGEADDYYLVCSGNMVDLSKTNAILTRANFINGLDKEGLRKFYSEQRRMPRREGTPGANIGLIEMVRKSGNPLICEVEPVDDKWGYLILSVRVSKELQYSN